MVRVVPVRAAQHEARGVPDLVGEGAVSLDALLVELDVAALSRHRREREPQRVRAVLGGDVQRVDHVSARLGHLLAVLVAHHGVQEHDAERHLAHEVQAQHGHAGDPEEEDVESGLQYRVRIKGAQGGRVVRPSERGERPQAGREPGVEHVRVLRQPARVTRLAFARRLARHRHVAVLAVPGGDLVSPPQLARDAPVVDVAHPAEELGLPLLRDEADAARLHRLDHGSGQRPGLHEPLLAEQRLDHALAALAAPERHVVRLAAALEAQLFQRRLDCGPHCDAILSLESPRVLVQRAVQVEDVDEREPVALAGLEVLEAMRRRDLHRPCPELRVH